jgi:hypothetical protein
VACYVVTYARLRKIGAEKAEGLKLSTNWAVCAVSCKGIDRTQQQGSAEKMK